MAEVIRPTVPNREVFSLNQWTGGDHHPRRPGYFALRNGHVTLSMTLPFGAQVNFALNQFPQNTWVTLQDASGQPIPLAVYVQGEAVTGRWL
jgi:hypothetical protein